MIRFLCLTPALLAGWLIDQGLPNAPGRYRLRVWRENRAGLAALQAELEHEVFHFKSMAELKAFMVSPR
jgi:hypothetical protein